jgi:hypothetical protein
MPASWATAGTGYSATTHGTAIDIVRSRIGLAACCSASRRSSDRSEPSRVFSGPQIEMKASISAQIRRCNGAACRSSSSGASRANGPPICSKESCRIG